MDIKKPATIDEYIATFPSETQQLLEQVRAAIKKTVPTAEEKISYAIPAFSLNGSNLVYFAGYKNHIGMYPVPGGHKSFEKEFSKYKTSGKGAIQFPLNKPMPLELISKIVTFRIKETATKAKKKVKIK